LALPKRLVGGTPRKKASAPSNQTIVSIFTSVNLFWTFTPYNLPFTTYNLLKLHHNLVAAVIDILLLIFNGGKYADQVIENKLKSNPKWGAKDRRFITQLAYELVRNWRLVAHLSPPVDPSYATPQEVWLMVGTWLYLQYNELPSWDELNGLDTQRLKSAHQKALTVRKIAYSIPDWLDDLGSTQMGEKRWASAINAMNKQANVYIRANKTRINRQTLQGVLLKEAVETKLISLAPDALLVEGRKNVVATKAFHNGLFEVQDAGSQLIAPYLDPRPNMTVIDACAGGGGKTLHISALMQNKGKIIALDVEDWKLDNLKERAKRNGISIIQTQAIISPNSIAQYTQKADRLLLDVPCTGLGTLRRKPDIKWKLSPEKLQQTLDLQQHILSVYSQMLRVGGLMVYATCSILPLENEEQIKQFLAQNPNFTLLGEQFVSPAAFATDGFYMAKMIRNH